MRAAPDSSPKPFWRTRKGQNRLFVVGGLVLVVGIVAVSASLFRNTAPDVDVAASTLPASIEQPQQRAPLDPDARTTAVAFIRAGVTRADVAEAWRLSTSELRSGLSKKQWLAGQVPIVPFPLDLSQKLEFKVDESYTDKALLSLFLPPTKGAGVKPTYFKITLVKVGEGASAQWRVSYWAPYDPPGKFTDPT